MKIAIVGVGAFGEKHLEALRAISGVEVVSLVGRRLEPTRDVAGRYAVPHATTDLAETLRLRGLDAVILCSPTPLHASQAIQRLDAGKHVQIEIPLCDRLADAEAVLKRQRESGLVAMVGHTRRFNPNHQFIHARIAAGQLAIQQMDVQTFFSGAEMRMRRANRAPGPIICCGIIPRTPSIYSPTRPVR